MASASTHKLIPSTLSLSHRADTDRVTAVKLTSAASLAVLSAGKPGPFCPGDGEPSAVLALLLILQMRHQTGLCGEEGGGYR